ncbi:hypothetical protein JCM10213v2_007763 [Rhodosporidiobolus nylandii]
MWTQGAGCRAEVKAVEMQQGWFIGATGSQFGAYGCNLTTSTGVSTVTWHTAQASSDKWDAVLCAWTSLLPNETYTASVVNSPSNFDGHGWLGVATFGFSTGSAAVSQIASASGLQINGIPTPAASLLSYLADSYTTIRSASSTGSASSSTSTSSSSADDSGPVFTRTALYACLSVGAVVAVAVIVFCLWRKHGHERPSSSSSHHGQGSSGHHGLSSLFHHDDTSSQRQSSQYSGSGGASAYGNSRPSSSYSGYGGNSYGSSAGRSSSNPGYAYEIGKGGRWKKKERRRAPEVSEEGSEEDEKGLLSSGDEENKGGRRGRK